MRAKAQQDLALARRRRIQPHRRLGRIMQGQAAGRALGVGLRLGQWADHRLDLGAGHRSGAQQARGAVQQGHHRRFQPHGAGPAVQGRGDGVAGLLAGVGEGGGAGPAGAIGRGRHHRPAEGAQQPLGHGMGRRAHGHGVEPRAGQVADRQSIAHRRHQGQRARPEGRRQGLGARVQPGDGARGLQVRHMGDQRIEAGPALGLIEGGHGGGVASVGGQAVDRLGGQDHQGAGAQGLGRRRQAGRRQWARCAVTFRLTRTLALTVSPVRH